MMPLYHGSNMEIFRIDLRKSKPGKDFGRGFYLNADKAQAMAMAERTCKRQQCGIPSVSEFFFDDSILIDHGDMNVKIFEGYSREWAEFVLLNRRNRSGNQAHSYDIVIGPIANDTVGVQIRRFIQGYIDIDRLITELKYVGNNAVQYFFGTQRAISYLTKSEKWETTFNSR